MCLIVLSVPSTRWRLPVHIVHVVSSVMGWRPTECFIVVPIARRNMASTSLKIE
ncbi:MAG TPA: hypothetical protein VJM08_11330 [Anaerolineales bacterium]|nr:hypothetical protein [Anaerolineales bacterium]